MVRGGESPEKGEGSQREELCEEKHLVGGGEMKAGEDTAWSQRLARMATGRLGDEKEEEANSGVPGNKDEGKARWKLLLPGGAGIHMGLSGQGERVGIGKGRRVSEPGARLGVGKAINY